LAHLVQIASAFKRQNEIKPKDGINPSNKISV